MLNVIDILEKLEESTLYSLLDSLNYTNKSELIYDIVENKVQLSHRTYEVIAFKCMCAANSFTEIEYYKLMGMSEEDAKFAQATDLYTGSQWNSLEDYLESMREMLTKEEFEREVEYWNDNKGTGLPRRTSGEIKV